MNKYLSDSDIILLTDGFGQGHFELIEKKLEKISKKWQLSNFQIIASFSANLVMTCMIEGRSKGVLKLSARDSENFNYEPRALEIFNHTSFVSLFEKDLSEKAILIEQIQPGHTLRKVDNLEDRVDVFLDLYQKIHKTPRHAEGFPSYLEWVNKITKYMKDHYLEHPLTSHMNEACEMIKSLWDTYSDITLLHGDFHHDNILKDQDDTYKIIDPKGVLGPVLFDLPRFILNEFDDVYGKVCIDHIRKVVDYMSQKLNVSKAVLQNCLYIETCMGGCWCLQDDPSLVEDISLLKMIEVCKKIKN